MIPWHDSTESNNEPSHRFCEYESMCSRDSFMRILTVGSPGGLHSAALEMQALFSIRSKDCRERTNKRSMIHY